MTAALEMDRVEEKRVVTCFLESDGEILILRRSDRVGTYRGKWAGVSGYIEKNVTDDEQAYTEIQEETGLSQNDVSLVNKGYILHVDDESLATRWLVQPYLFHIADRQKIKIDWEHKESRWIKPGDISEYETVPALKEALESVVQK